MGALRELAPSVMPTGLLDKRLLYRLRTDAIFSFPFGKATTPAAVPNGPFREEIALSTSFTESRSIVAVVHFPLAGLEAGGNITFETDGLDLCCCSGAAN